MSTSIVRGSLPQGKGRPQGRRPNSRPRPISESLLEVFWEEDDLDLLRQEEELEYGLERLGYLHAAAVL